MTDTTPDTTPSPASSDAGGSPGVNGSTELSQTAVVDDATSQTPHVDVYADEGATGAERTGRHAAADGAAGVEGEATDAAAEPSAGHEEESHLASADDDQGEGGYADDDQGEGGYADDDQGEGGYDDEPYDDEAYDEAYDDEPRTIGGSFADAEDYDDIVVEPWSGTAQRWDIAEDDDENPHLVLSHLDDDVAIDAPITLEMIDGLCLSMDYYPEPPAHSSTIARTTGWAAASRAWDSIPAEYRKWVTIGVILIVVATLILRIVLG